MSILLAQFTTLEQWQVFISLIATPMGVEMALLRWVTLFQDYTLTKLVFVWLNQPLGATED